MSEERTQNRCIAPDEFTPGRCPESTTHPSGLCGGHQALAAGAQESLIQVDESLPEAPILAEMKWVATEARATMFAKHDPERLERLQARKAALLVALREW